MPAGVGGDGGGVSVRIAVAAQVRAAVVRANIGREVAGAGSVTGGGAARRSEPGVQRLLIGRDRHAAAAIDAIGRELLPLGAGLEGHAVGGGNLRHRRAEPQPVGLLDGAGFGEVAPHLLVEIEEADDAGLGIPLERGGQRLEVGEVPLDGVGLVEQDRVVPPADRIHPDRAGQRPEIRHDLPFLRHAGLDLAAVGGDRDKPVLPGIPAQFTQMRQHRAGVLGAEGDQVNNRRVKSVAGQRRRGVGAAHKHKALSQAVQQPGGVKGRDVGAQAGVDNHGLPFRGCSAHPLMAAAGGVARRPLFCVCCRHTGKGLTYLPSSQIGCLSTHSPYSFFSNRSRL